MHCFYGQMAALRHDMLASGAKANLIIELELAQRQFSFFPFNSLLFFTLRCNSCSELIVAANYSFFASFFFYQKCSFVNSLSLIEFQVSLEPSKVLSWNLETCSLLLPFICELPACIQGKLRLMTAIEDLELR